MLLIDFFRGLRVLRVASGDRLAVFGCLAANGICAKTCVWEESGVLRLTLYETDYRRFAAAAEQVCCPVPETVSEYGISAAVKRIRHRPGAAAGLFFAGLVLILSSLFVWRVDVVCLDNGDAARQEDYVDTEAVKARLREQGVGCGTFLPTFDSRHAEAQFLIGQSEVSWIAVNRMGTVLSVEVRPARTVENDVTGAPHDAGDGVLTGANLVADADGKIVRWELRNGMPVVMAEEMVEKGQILATGVFESRDGDVRFSRVSGKVFADTMRRLQTDVPLNAEETVYTGEREIRRTLMWFGHDFALPTRRETDGNVTFLQIFRNLLGNAGFSATEYVIIKDENSLHLPDGTPLPISVRTETRYGTARKARRLTEEEARKTAAEELERQRAAMTDAEILSEEHTEEITGDVLHMTWDIFCIDNIAEAREFRILPDPPAEGTDTGKMPAAE